jgi:hypothetical protein
VVQLYDKDTIIRLKQEGKTWEEIGKHFNKSGETIRGYARNQDWYADIKQHDPHDKTNLEDKIKRNRKIKEDGSIVDEIEKHFREPTEPKTPAEFMELHKYDASEFVFVNGESNVWTVTNAEGVTYYNVQSKIKVRPLGENELTIDELIEQLRKEPEPIEIELLGEGERNLVIGLADLHFGVTSFDYLKEQLAEVMEVVMNGYDTIVIEQLGDLFHSAQMKNTITVRGTILPTVDMEKAWADAKLFYYMLIEHCLKYANKVQIEHAQGNHSAPLEYAFLDLIKDRYELVNRNLEVNVHNDWRIAYRLGNVGIMVAHGDNVKINDLPDMFSRDYKMLWGDTESHEVHAGHKHEKFKEYEAKNGTVMRQFPTPKPKDDWEDMKGYDSRKMIELIEYDENRSRVVYEI